MADRFIDITADSCPMTFVKAKLELEKLSPGEVLEVVLQGTEPLENVPRSAEESGYRVRSVEPIDGGRHRLLIALEE
jgi:tRNA 2-thiouridine synthesizing protein A